MEISDPERTAKIPEPICLTGFFSAYTPNIVPKRKDKLQRAGIVLK